MLKLKGILNRFDFLSNYKWLQYNIEGDFSSMPPLFTHKLYIISNSDLWKM